MSQKTQILKAVSNKTRQLLLRLISLDKDINREEINEHVEIDQPALMYHIGILKSAGLINNHTFEVDGEQRTVYNINKLGQQCLSELGFK